MINAITTNLTGFFREPHHFEMLAKEAIPEIVEIRQEGASSADLVGGMFLRRGALHDRDDGAADAATGGAMGRADPGH